MGAGSGPTTLTPFDGTISLEDTTDVILERFTDPEWRKVEAEWLAGRIGSRKCLLPKVRVLNIARIKIRIRRP